MDFLTFQTPTNSMELSLRNTIVNATRITSNTHKLIHPILVSEDVSLFYTGTIDIKSSVSDHKASTYIFVKTSVNYNKAYTRNIWLYKHADFDK